MEASIRNSLIKNRNNILKDFKNFKQLSDNLDKNTDFDSKETNDLNEFIGDFCENILNDVKDTGFIKQLIEHENKALYSDDIMSIYQINLYEKDIKKNPNIVMENSLFEAIEEEMCLRAANFFNIFAHKLKEEELEIAKNLNLIKYEDLANKKDNNYVSGIFDKATRLKEQTKYYFKTEDLEEEIESKGYDTNSSNIKKIHEIMKKCGIGKGNFSLSQTKQFIEAIKVNELKHGMYNCKVLSFESMVHNISSKERYVEKLKKEEKSEKEIAKYDPEIAVIMCNEGKDFTVKGNQTVRICGSGKKDIHTIQFHVTKKECENVFKKFDYEIAEYDDLKKEFPISCSIPRSEAQNTEKREKILEAAKVTVYNTKLFVDGPFKEINNLVKKLKKVAQFNRDNKKIEEINGRGI